MGVSLSSSHPLVPIFKLIIQTNGELFLKQTNKFPGAGACQYEVAFDAEFYFKDEKGNKVCLRDIDFEIEASPMLFDWNLNTITSELRAIFCSNASGLSGTWDIDAEFKALKRANDAKHQSQKAHQQKIVVNSIEQQRQVSRTYYDEGSYHLFDNDNETPEPFENDNFKEDDDLEYNSLYDDIYDDPDLYL